MKKYKIAQIKENDAYDGETITIYLDSNLAVSLSNGEDPCLPVANNVAEAFGLIEIAWWKWESFSWLGDYNEETGKIEEYSL